MALARSKRSGLYLYLCKLVLLPMKWLLFAQVFTVIIWAIDLSIRPYLVKMILDSVSALVGQGNDYEVIIPAALYAAMFILISVTYRFYDWITLKKNPVLKKRVASVMMDHLMGHSNEHFQSQFTGSLVGRVNDVMNGITIMITMIIDRFFGLILALSIAIYTMWRVSYVFSLILIIWTCVLILLTSMLIHRSKKLAEENSEAWFSVSGQIVDILANIASIRFFVGKQHENMLFASHISKAVDTEQKCGWFLLKMHALQNFTFLAFQGICLLVLIKGIKNGHFSAGDFALILSLNTSISDNLMMISQDFTQFTEHLGKVFNGLSMIFVDHAIENKPFAEKLVVDQGQIVFENVKFQYKETAILFDNKQIFINHGEKIGLVGHSGSGKSTFVNLILRLFEVQDGRILIDGQDISLVTLESLRSAIAIVPQDLPLFHRTLIENIRYGRLDASDAEVEVAAKKAHAHDFIMKLPDGYQTMVGERGAKLSTGQRQRIAIARAALKNAPILILDEATSALDSITEAQIQESLWGLMQDKTTIVIAHRLSTLLWMDRIFVLDKGKIIAEGSHDDLLNSSPEYKELWNTQIGSFV